MCSVFGDFVQRDFCVTCRCSASLDMIFETFRFDMNRRLDIFDISVSQKLSCQTLQMVRIFAIWVFGCSIVRSI